MLDHKYEYTYIYNIYIYIRTTNKSRNKFKKKTFYKRTLFGIYNHYLYNNIYVYILDYHILKQADLSTK